MVKRSTKKGRAARNARKKNTDKEPQELLNAPHSFVINRGSLGKNGNELLLNFRKLMEPYTAAQLRVQKKNVLKDFLHIAGPLNVSHMVVFTKSEIGFYLKLIRLPRGPTLTFKIQDYVFARDVISSLKKSLVYEKLFQHHPLLVLNNFSGEGLHFKMITAMFQSLFPTINVNKVNLNAIRRCVLLNYNSEEKFIELRHYAIKVVPCGMSKAVKKLIQNHVPDLGNFNDFDEYMSKSGNLSESEAELDGPTNQVILPQAISSRGNIVAQKSSIRLFELGPRLKLSLLKIQEEVMTGEVIYHQFVQKTQDPEESKLRKKKKRKLSMIQKTQDAEEDELPKKKKTKLSMIQKTQDTEEDKLPKKKKRKLSKIQKTQDPEENKLHKKKKRKFSK